MKLSKKSQKKYEEYLKHMETIIEDQINYHYELKEKK